MKTKQHKEPFTQIYNDIVFDRRLSLKARGVLLIILARPEGWEIYVNELLRHSEKDKKSSFQTAFKELVEYDYLRLTVFRDENNRRLSGTRYVLGKSARRVSSQSEFQTRRFSGSQKSDSLNNMKESNTDCTVKHNQHQNSVEKIAGVVGGDISFYFEQLKMESKWRSHFEKQMLGNSPLGAERFELLLLAFRENAEQRGNIYESEHSVKAHFSNWFGKMKREQQLHIKIAEQKSLQESLLNDVKKTIAQIDWAIDQIKGKSFKSIEQIKQVSNELPKSLTLLNRAQKQLLRNTVKGSLSSAISDTEKLISKLEKGEREGKLHLVCMNRFSKI